ncbi:kinetochore protein NDC80 homolog [Contarinia nasturtii]|uniref:kinetochore protein NDC80 homolog n=1 Tax=Contarinia nasturtii TaxID=265458 RepID=UPI0012D3AE70|nr:kinetochore protein NDC80 homolog [Contarinia nasturtii]
MDKKTPMRVSRSSRMTTHDLTRHHRLTSGSQSNLLESADRRQTVSGLPRSSSNMRTPLPTRSPGTRTPSSTGTSNSEQNRRMATENAFKVMNLLQSSQKFYKSLNLGNTGLKSMTMNQFIDIISFLMVKIGGKNTIAKIRSSTENVIISFMQSLNYPYVLNKSCLKTPNAHHSFPDVVAMLAFLADLVCDIKQYTIPTAIPVTPCENLINDKYAELFSAETQRNYIDYIASKRENYLDEEGEAKLINGIIAIKLNKPDITIEKLTEKAEQLRKISADLEKKLVGCDDKKESDKYFTVIEHQVMNRENEEAKLQEDLIEKRKCLKMVTMVRDEKARILADKQVELQRLMQAVDNQKSIRLDMKQLTAQEMSLKNAKAMLQTEKDTIQAEAVDAQVKLARYQKLRMDAIKKFNDFTFHTTKKLMQIPSMQRKNLNVNDFTIDPTDTHDTIQNICSRQRKLGDDCAQDKLQKIDKIQQNNDKLIEYKSLHNQLNDQFIAEMNQFQEANNKLIALKRKRSDFESNGSTCTNKLKRDIEEKIAIKAQITEEIAVLNAKAQELETQNREIFEDGERQAHEIIRNKQLLCDELDKFNEFLDDETDKF